MPDTQKGFLLISDISGYTMYLNDSELDHAQETLTALLELLVDNTCPPLVISRLEGDAVISYGLVDSFFSGQTFIELIENTYVAFRKAIERMVLNNTCRCRACANVSQLDLKFFSHYGEFGIQRIKDHQELVGSDVNLIHRLLKNQVPQETGIRAYALYTERALRRLGLDDLRAALTPHVESYPPIGKVTVWVQDMAPIWRAEKASRQVDLPTEEIAQRLSVEIDMPLQLTWDYLIDPEFRRYLHGSDRQEVSKRTNGRIGPGSAYQCFHGDTAVPQTILEWRPFDTILTREIARIPVEGTYYFAQYRLSEGEIGTLLDLGFTSARGPWLGRLMIRLMDPIMAGTMTRNIERFKMEIERDYMDRRRDIEPTSAVSEVNSEAQLRSP